MVDISTLKLEVARPEQLDLLVEIQDRSAHELNDPILLSRHDLVAMQSWHRMGPAGVQAVLEDDRIVGLLRYGRYLDAREPTVLAIVTVDPAFRDAGVADWVYDQVRAQAVDDGARLLDTIVDSRDRDASDFLQRRGFKELVSIWTMEADPDFAPGEAPSVPLGYRLRPYVAGQDAARLAQILNRVFDQHESFAPVTEAEVQSIEHTVAFEPRLTFFLESDAGEAVACARNTIRADRRDAWIDVLGVIPEFQGRGLGRFLLLQSLHILAASKPKQIRLTVEGTNERARSLYDSEGFMELRTRIRYRKSLVA
jgi:mycothiol synthase